MVKCSECGYLSIRNKNNDNLDEADIEFREKGIVPTLFDNIGRNPHHIHKEIPLCLEHKSLGSAINNLKNPSNPFEEIKLAIQEERDCKEFTKWQQGFTPKEHREMMDRKTMLELEEKRRQNDRKWHWIELAILVVGAGLFTLLGAWITSISQRPPQ